MSKAFHISIVTAYTGVPLLLKVSITAETAQEHTVVLGAACHANWSSENPNLSPSVQFKLARFLNFFLDIVLNYIQHLSIIYPIVKIFVYASEMLCNVFRTNYFIYSTTDCAALSKNLSYFMKDIDKP